MGTGARSTRRRDHGGRSWGLVVGTAALLFAGSTTALAGSTTAAGPAGPVAPGCVTAAADVSSPEVTTLAADLGLTPADAAVRIGWQNGAEALDGRARASTGSYGGLWIDPASGRIKLGSTSATATHRLRSAAAGCGLGAAVDVVAVKHSAATLEAAGRWVGARIAAVDDPRTGGFSVGVDFSTNRVLLDVPAHRALSAAERDLVSAATARWGSAVELRSVTADAAPAACSTDNFCTAPLRGGVRMYSESAGCSLGFTARSRVDGRWYALSAGHCGGGTWRTRFPDGSEHAIGPWHNGTFSSRGDAQIIRVANPAGWTPRPWVLVEASADTTRNEAYTISAVAGSTIGMRICKTGFSGGTDCGTVTRLGVTVDYGSVVVRNMGEANFCVIPGDSGGPVYASHRAHGLTSGYSPGASPCRSFYQGAAGAEDLMNVDIATG